MSKKTVLIIEDERIMLEAIKFEFETNKDYEFEVTGVGTEKEAIKLLTEIEQKEDMQPFDVMIIDVKLEEEKSGVELLGLLSLTEYADKCGKSIKIVFTGWPEYEDCVRCMRHGGYDYIVKGKKGKSIAKVVDSAVSRLKEIERREQERKYIDEEWMFKHRKDFRGKYAGQYIAVVDTGEIITAAPDIISLRQNIKAKNLDKEPFIIGVD
ncbi:MAG: response regulator [bacterium]|nr:response regulator [bacterium]